MSGAGLRYPDRLDERSAEKERVNWGKWFRRLNGYIILIRHKPSMPFPDRASVHQELRMGDFYDQREADVCVDDSAAKHYVREQLLRFCFQ